MIEAALVVLVGGANIDILARSSETATLHTSNPGTTSSTLGGVARNIAENLARLGTATQLLAAVGDDDDGRRLLQQTAAAGVGLSHILPSVHPTGTYTAILDADGDLIVAVADMAATDGVRPMHLGAVPGLLARAALLVIDGNLAPVTVEHLLDLATRSRCRAILEPVSAPKAARLASVLSAGRPLYAVTPNRDELAALTGERTDDEAGLALAVQRLHGRGVEWVWVRLGDAGSILSRSGAPWHRFPAPPVAVVDVTGAGDAMLAAFAHALLAGHPPPLAARYGHAAAALTVASPQTVRPDMSVELLEQTLAGHTTS